MWVVSPLHTYTRTKETIWWMEFRRNAMAAISMTKCSIKYERNRFSKYFPIYFFPGVHSPHIQRYGILLFWFHISHDGRANNWKEKTCAGTRLDKNKYLIDTRWLTQSFAFNYFSFLFQNAVEVAITPTLNIRTIPIWIQNTTTTKVNKEYKLAKCRSDSP